MCRRSSSHGCYCRYKTEYPFTILHFLTILHFSSPKSIRMSEEKVFVDLINYLICSAVGLKNHLEKFIIEWMSPRYWRNNYHYPTIVGVQFQLLQSNWCWYCYGQNWGYWCYRVCLLRQFLLNLTGKEICFPRSSRRASARIPLQNRLWEKIVYYNWSSLICDLWFCKAMQIRKLIIKYRFLS